MLSIVDSVKLQVLARVCYFRIYPCDSANPKASIAKKATATKSVEVTIDDIFGAGGLLEKSHPGYEFRSSQLEMARMVDEAFQKKQHSIIEAGTGTGKTLAYLIPAIRSGRRVVISTATKSLQEQLFNKDVPFLQKHFAPNLKAALMKGRNNFLCRTKVNQIDGPGRIERHRRDRLVLANPRLGKANRNWRPQRADLSCLTTPNCGTASTPAATCAPARNAAEFNRCFITAMHQRAQEADLIIVNHHLFFADLAIRQDDFGSILPEYSAVVFDEAHEIEDVASDYFGRRVSSYQFEELSRDTENMLRVLRIEADAGAQASERECANEGAAFSRISRNAKAAFRLAQRKENLFWSSITKHLKTWPPL